MADACKPAELFYRILQLREEIDNVSAALLGDSANVFGPVSHAMPKLDPAELGFLRVTAFLYALLFEVGRVGVTYLGGLQQALATDTAGNLQRHLDLVDRLRTLLQHNLDPGRSRDAATLEACHEWLEAQCGSRFPTTEEHWNHCLCALLTDACAALETLLRSVRAIESDESRETLIAQWKFAASRYHPPEQFDRIISEVAADLGFIHLDVVRFRKRFYDRWVEQLRVLRGGYDFEIEGRRLVEQAILADVGPALPLTGADILREFEVEPGPVVRQGLELVKVRYLEQPCSKEELVSYLRGLGFPRVTARRSSGEEIQGGGDVASE